MTMARYDILLGAGMANTVDLGTYVKQLCADLADVHGTEHRNVHQACSTIPMPVDLDTVTALGMAAAEVVTNCYVHAFPDGRSGTIDVSLSVSEVGDGTLTIKDNWIGFDITAESKRHGVRIGETANAANERIVQHQIEWRHLVDAELSETWTNPGSLALHG
jgi:two-component sensor histidine kinase